MKKRVFIAIDLPQKIKGRFVNFFEKVKKIDIVKWEKAEKMHLTLAFLGFVEEKMISTIVVILKSISVGISPFSLSIVPNIEGFPTTANPRVIFLQIEGEVAKLQEISESLQHALLAQKFVFDEREFLAHLTLGRFKGGVGKWQKERIVKETVQALPKQVLAFPVNGITLYQSQLTPQGSVYKKLHYEDFSH